jgi:hydrogenase maturation protease
MSSVDKEILLIGYGSTLRGDDAAGRVIVERIADRSLPNVTAISLTQLVPELAEIIAKAYAVIFVDASAERDIHGVDVREISGVPGGVGSSHMAVPEELLALTSTCYERKPPAWLVAVPSTEFGLTDRISTAAHKNLVLVVHAVERLINELNESEVAHA